MLPRQSPSIVPLTNTASVTYSYQDTDLTTSSSVAFERRIFMPCAFNSCCNTCPRFVRTTAVSVVGTTLRLTIPTTTAVNHQRLCVCIAQSIPGTATPNMNVILVDGATLIPLVTKCGNFVYADQVKSRKVLRLTVATDIPQATVNNSDCLCPTAHVFPVLPPVVASEVALANPKSI